MKNGERLFDIMNSGKKNNINLKFDKCLIYCYFLVGWSLREYFDFRFVFNNFFGMFV